MVRRWPVVGARTRLWRPLGRLWGLARQRLGPGSRVLDLGCGIGRFTDFYISQGCDVVAVDARAENIAELQRRYPAVQASTSVR